MNPTVENNPITVVLSQVEVNLIRLFLENDPLVKSVIEDGLSTGQLYTHHVLCSLLEKLPYRETTEEEREASYKAVDVRPLDHYFHGIKSGEGFQW